MDTTTITAIIKMIDTRIEGLNELLKKADSVQWTAQVEILTSLSNHLDCCLEMQLNAEHQYEIEHQLEQDTYDGGLSQEC
jgi:hypothetical protein